MNVKLFAVSTMVFGIVIGVTVSHYHQVNHLVKHGVPPLAFSATKPGPESLDGSSPDAVATVELAVTEQVVSQQQSAPQMIVRGSKRDDALLEILTAIRNEQQSIRKQISESNRDIDELTFRVDTHSDSFKPLQTEVERPRSLDKVTDPLGAEDVILLPPKQ